MAILAMIYGRLDEERGIADSVISYANSACVNIFGDLRGQTIKSLLCEIAGSTEVMEGWVKDLELSGSLMIEGELKGRFVKYHSVLGEDNLKSDSRRGRFIQAAITDITESVILKERVYGTSEALKRVASAADEDTGKHVARINLYSEHLAELMGLDDQFVEDISRFAQLHDIGKIQVLDLIRKPDKLTDSEFEEVKKHTVYGAKIVEGLPGMEMAYNIALEHHERWDGSGYPEGKAGEEISIEGRIVALGDVFDALIFARAYKPSISPEKVFDIFKQGDGRVMPTHFDPRVHQCFLKRFDDFVDIARIS
ncbi:MAG: HD domain-containing phosphohydrolase [Mariprofundaceae bacterium]